MCDQTEVSYSDGDVVWVKIGPIWWPGVVKDVSKDGNEEEVFRGLKNRPIATVQFFNEEKVEFVRTLDHIYLYNCSKKDEFLKKGLDKFRAGAKHMVKFPEDIVKAEELVNGDKNILKDPKFAPPEKKNYNDLFGPPKKPKARKTEDLTLKSKLPLKKRLSAPSHRPVSSYFTPETFDRKEISCRFCDFSATLTTTMSSHFVYFHSSRKADYGESSTPKRPRPTPSTNKRKSRVAKPKADAPNSSISSAKSTPVTKAVVNPVNPEKKKRFTDALLADWSEDEDKDKEDEKSTIDLNENQSQEVEMKEETMPAEIIKKDNVSKVVEGENNHHSSGSIEESNDNDKRETSSCFDFDDEDDGFIGMSDAYTYGRKIPRVIPVKDKTDLGRDLEVDEVFKKKPDADEMEGVSTIEKPLKKRRGRPSTKNVLLIKPKNDPKTPYKAPIVKNVKTVPTPRDGLAATRQRRSGARKSYLNLSIGKEYDVIEPESEPEPEPKPKQEPKPEPEILKELEPETPTPEKIETNEPEEESEAEETPKPSRRKQDLKRQKLLEYDDAMLAGIMRKKQDSEAKKKIIIVEKEDLKIKNTLTVGKDELSPDGKVSKNTSSNDEDLSAQVESLLAETKAPNLLSKPPSFSPTRIIQSKEESINPEIEYLEDDPPPIVSPIKKIIPLMPIKNIKTLDLEQVVKKSTIPQWKQGIQESLKLNKEHHATNEVMTKVAPPKANIIKLSTHRAGQPQKILVLSQSQGLASKSLNTAHRFKIASLPRTTQSSLVQMNPGKKVITLSSAVQQKMMNKLNGNNKTVFVKTSSISRKILVKGPDGNLTYKSLVPTKRPQHIVFNNQTVKYVPKAEEIVQAPVVEPALEPVTPDIVSILSNSQQVVLPPTGDGQTTYMLVDVGGQTVLQASHLPFNIQPAASTQLYQASNDETKQVYSSPGQDILAEALANTNVLESEMPLMMQKPIMTPMEIPCTALPDHTLIIAPAVQETSVTLQKPIMTPVEVPTSVVADTSGLEPPPLPPTPTAEDVMMDDPEDSLMIAEQQQQQPIASDDTQNQNFFIDDSQEVGEVAHSFQSMPLLNEESTASEEHIGDQNFVVQGANLENNEYLPSSTNPDLEPTEEEIPLLSYSVDETQEEVGSEEKDVQSLPFLSEEGFAETGEVHSSQETEVTSTTCDSKEEVL